MNRTKSSEQRLKTALRAAKAAGRIHLERFGRVGKIGLKSTPIDLVSEADLESEAAILKIIKRHFPEDSILAEESAASGAALSSESLWIIDPLDGTTNFAHSYPHFSVSIAYQERGRLLIGVIYDALKKEMFIAQRGRGAFLNGQRIRVSTARSLSDALLGTGFAYDRRERADFYLAFWKAFMMRTQGTRRSGAASLDLAYVACGRLDAFWEFGLKAWDVAAGALLIQEAGGRVSNVDGSPLVLDAGNIVGSNGRLHRAMVSVLKETKSMFDEKHP